MDLRAWIGMGSVFGSQGGDMELLFLVTSLHLLTTTANQCPSVSTDFFYFPSC